MLTANRNEWFILFTIVFQALGPPLALPSRRKDLAWLRVHAYVTWVLFEVIVAMSFLVVVVFWTLLTPDAATAGSFLNINQHVLNMVLTYTCFTLSRVHIVFSHFVFFLLIAALYMVTQFV